MSAWQVPGEPVPFAAAVGQPFEPVAVGWRWGRAWSTTWFRVTGEVPAAWRDGTPPGTRAEILVDFGYNRSRSGFQAEGLAYRPDGRIIKAIAPLNSYVPWRPEDGPAIDLLIEAAANPDVAGEYTFEPTPFGTWETAPDEPLYELRRLELALLDVAVWELAQDVWTLRGLMEQLPVDSTRRHTILRALEDMLDAARPGRHRRDRRGRPGRPRRRCSRRRRAPSAHRVVAIGQRAHRLGLAVAGPRDGPQVRRARSPTWSSLHGRAPGLRVRRARRPSSTSGCKEHYPALFARIREKVAAGRFVPVGGMWVESDTNMPGSRGDGPPVHRGQAVLPRRVRGRVRGGLAARLVRVLRRRCRRSCARPGARWFLTQKISWNDTNRMPHHTFWWEGIDGSRVFTHFPPVDTYISELSGAELAHAERNFSEKGRATISLVPFGWGDGGGGPTREMIARGPPDGRPRGLAAGRGSTRPTAFFRAAEAEYPDAPVWVGRDVPRAPPGRVHLAAADQAGQPPQRGTSCARRSCGPRRPPSGPAWRIRAPSSRRPGGPCCCSSSTTSCPGRRSPGCTARRSGATPR